MYLILFSITVIYYIFGLSSGFLAYSSPNPWNCLSVGSDKSVFCYVIEIMFGKHLGMGGRLPGEPTRWLEGWNFQSYPLTSGEGRGAGDGVPSPVVHDFINCAYVTKSP